MTSTIKVDSIQANSATDVTIADSLNVDGAVTLDSTLSVTGAATANTFSSSGATITGGTITGITDLAVADGGTGASTAAAARTNLDVPSTSEAILDTLIDAKGDIIVGTAADTPARKAVGSNGQILVAASGESDGLIWTDYTREPINVNPNWLIDQINEGALYTVGANTQGPDGWSGSLTGAGVFKLRRIADPDNAALKCLEITCTTADAAIAATDQYQIYTSIEGYDAADLMAGTASASKITIQFKFKSNVTGVYGISVINSAANRSYVGTINVADTNEHDYTVTLTLDTAGTWLYTNGTGLQVRLMLAGGTNFQTTAGSWQAGNFNTTSEQCNFMSANTSVAYLKRFHVIPGGVALAYHKQDIERELRKAHRYFDKTYPQGTIPGTVTNTGAVEMVTPTGGFLPIFPEVSMRTSGITYSFYSSADGQVGTWNDVSAATNRAAVANIGGERAFSIALTGPVAGNLIRGHYTRNARLS